MDITLNWKDGMAFEGVGPSGFTQKIDASETVGGSNSAIRPMELIAFGLAGCAGMDVISILQKKHQAVKDFQIKLHASTATEHPKVFTATTIEYIVTGKNIDPVAVLRAIELSVEKYCPAEAMLSKAFSILSIYKIYDENRNLTHEGEYPPQPPTTDN